MKPDKWDKEHYTVIILHQFKRKYWKNKPMKNEPVVSYNHMQEEEAITKKTSRIPYSLYVLLFVDAILISALSVFVAKIIF